MQPEQRGDRLRGVGSLRQHGSFLPILISALLLALALGRVGLRVTHGLNEARCAGFWDDGTTMLVEDARDRDYCRHFEDSLCRVAEDDDPTPNRRVFHSDERLPLLMQLYADAEGKGASPSADPAKPREPGFSAERCGDRLALRLGDIASPGDLLTQHLTKKSTRVERRKRGGTYHRCKRIGGRFKCEPKHRKHWDWVGNTTHSGVPVVRMHVSQDARKTLRVARPEGRSRLNLIYGFTNEAQRLRTPLLGFVRLRVRHAQRFLYRGVIYPRFQDDEVVIDLSSVPEGDDLEFSIDGLGSRFGEVWLSGRFLR